MKSELDYLKKMFIPLYGEELSDDECTELLNDSSDESKLFKSFLATLKEQREDLLADNKPKSDNQAPTENEQDELWGVNGGGVCEIIEDTLFRYQTTNGNTYLHEELCSEFAHSIIQELKSEYSISKK